MHTSFWLKLDARVAKLTADERRVVERYIELAKFSDRPADLEDAADLVETVVRALRAAGVTGRRLTDRLDAGAKDPRWELLHALEEAAYQKVNAGKPLDDDARHTPWHPLRISGGGWIADLNGSEPRSALPLVIEVDPRISYGTLADALRRAWPKLKAAGAVHASRPLGDRKAQLVRLVCLEMPDASWAERLAAWNRKHRGERYSTTQALQTALHDAEESLTGDRHGLAWFYSAKARLPRTELAAIARQGDREAQGELTRRLDAVRGLATVAGGEVLAVPASEEQARPRVRRTVNLHQPTANAPRKGARKAK